MFPHAIVHVLLALLLPPLLLGVVNRTKATFAGRTGPPLLQPYYDLWKLLRKGMVVSSATSPMFLAGPTVGLVITVAAVLLVPLGHHPAVIAFPGDMILFAYLLALGRFCTAAAALDTGSPFEGMGAAREVTFAWLAEPALFLGFVALARMTGSFSLTGMLGGDLAAAPHASAGSIVLIVVGWFIVLLAENCRIPFDDPNTHLELTMIHEVMVLDHSGPLFGCILYGAAMKLFVLGALFTDVLAPFSTGSSLADWGLFIIDMMILAVVIGTVESVMARLRLVRIPQLLVAASILTAFSLVLVLR
jgi:formate hydrogenlyase subunit 4